MFAKVFSQIFNSSISEDHVVRHVFMDLLVLSDSSGCVDMTHEAIARQTNVPIEMVRHAIDKLSSPDESSRTKDEDGRRITPIDEHRSWGWYIVNFMKYREIRDEEARRIANRSYKQMQRDRQKRQQVSAPVSTSQPMSANTEERRENKKNSTTLVRFATDEVRAIYDAYPRKTKPRVALKAIEAALKRLDVNDPASWLLETTKSYARSPQGNRGNYTPHPSSWYNASSYLEDPDEWEKVGFDR